MKVIGILWKDKESYGYSDILLLSALRGTNLSTLVHEVRGPQGGRYFAKCRVTSNAALVDLDYAAYPAYNRKHGFYLGVMRIHFERAGNVRPSGVQWRYEGQKAFAKAKIEIFSPKLPIGTPYVPGPKSAKMKRLVRERPGQGEFKSALVLAYGGQCCVTGCDVSSALEGAHIDPYAGGRNSDDPQNGLLLRSDLHALFDARQMAIEPNSRRAHFSDDARSFPEYRQLHKRRIHSPQIERARFSPSQKALERRWKIFQQSQ